MTMPSPLLQGAHAPQPLLPLPTRESCARGWTPPLPMLLFAAASLSFWAFPAPLLHRAAPRLLMQQPHLSEHEESASPPREAPAPAIDPPQVEKVDKPTPIIVHESGSQCGRVLLIYTGGTLGMIKNDGAWLPHHESGNLGRLIQLMPEFHDDKMPDMDMIEYAPLLDSSNIGPKDWCSLAGQIGVHYYDYDGFVVIHGTDTMAYTASALSFMLEGLGKAVVLTGSIIPMREPFNDARRNLIASIMIASQLELSEVAIFFDNQLLRGNRAVKSDTHGLEGFTSPNFPPLALVGADGITARDRRLWRPQPVCRLRVHTNLEVNTVVIRLTPGFDDSAINAMIQHAPNLRGLVLSLYGTGNGPSHKEDFMRVVREAVRRDILVVAVTQCLRGAVTLDTYEVGRRLLEIGVISAGDMTCEAVVTKISYLCGRGLKGEDLRNAMTTDLRGEVTTASAVQDNHVRLYRAERL